jgi:hypothetical protein
VTYSFGKLKSTSIKDRLFKLFFFLSWGWVGDWLGDGVLCFPSNKRKNIRLYLFWHEKKIGILALIAQVVVNPTTMRSRPWRLPTLIRFTILQVRWTNKSLPKLDSHVALPKVPSLPFLFSVRFLVVRSFVLPLSWHLKQNYIVILLECNLQTDLFCHPSYHRHYSMFSLQDVKNILIRYDDTKEVIRSQSYI